MVRKSKMDKAMETLLAMVADSGVDTSELEDMSIPRHNYRSNDAVVVFANVPAHFKPGICKECKRTFAVNKKSVGYCSDPCRDENWRRTTGLSPNVVKIHDVWDGDPPMIITPDQYDKLKAIADWFTENESVLQVTQTETEWPDIPSHQMELPDHFDQGLPVSHYNVSHSTSLALDEPRTNPAFSLDLSEPKQKLPEVSPFEF